MRKKSVKEGEEDINIMGLETEILFHQLKLQNFVVVTSVLSMLNS